MKIPSLRALLGPAVLVLSLTGSAASPSHERLHHLAARMRRAHGHAHELIHSRAKMGLVQKRGGQCQFPTDDPNLVAITPEGKNAGWAMSPDQECKPGSYCPIACKPGMVMAQWDPKSTYSTSSRMNGGLFCDRDGKVHKPFPNKPNCVHGTGAVKVVNQCQKPMSWCQTVLPGNELMAIPTLAEVATEVTIAVPGIHYWQKTSAHFYVNPPGTGVEGCVWGSESESIGNWSPYVVGANTDSNGATFVKLGWNPKFLEITAPAPDYSLKIECPDGGCVGLPCEIRSSSGKGRVASKLAATGAGNADFCVVTVAQGKSANVVVSDHSGGGSSAHPPKKPEPSQEPEFSMPSIDELTSMAEPTSIATPVSSSSPSPTPTTPTTTPAPSTTPMTFTSTTSSAPASTTSDDAERDMKELEDMEQNLVKEPSSTSAWTRPTAIPGIFRENGTQPTNVDSGSSGATSMSQPTLTAEAPPPSTPVFIPDSTCEAGRQQSSGAIAGLVVAFIAAAYLF
ncbi:hypothetical protein HIM_00583 [Hirsutella minnesotensis 3608]|nr:hypothetical protein HIM_00583 [Hirsutella minnesotensis 3608]